MGKEKGAGTSAKKNSLRARKTLVAYSFIMPNLIGFFVFTFVPIVFSLFLSFCEWDSGNPIKFVGLKNFIYMFTKDNSFRISLLNTIYYTVVTVPVTLALSLFLAILMNKPLKGRVFFRSVLFFPYVASLVAIAVVWMGYADDHRPDRMEGHGVLHDCLSGGFTGSIQRFV